MGKSNPQDEKLDKLKDANKKLRAKVRQLQKVNKMLQHEMAAYSELFACKDGDLKPEPKKNKLVCKECGEPADKIVAGIFTILKCTKCTWKERQ